MPRNNLTPRKLRRKPISSVAPSRDGQHAYDPILGEILVSKDGAWQLASGFSPASLFANGEQGAWYDISDLSTLFQDDLGTIPADYGVPVGLMLDKSGRGNHASQPTVTARPTLGRVPASGRRNLLVSSDDINLWPNGGDRTASAGSFDGKKLWEVSDADTTFNHSTSQALQLKANTTYVYSGLIKKGLGNLSMISIQGAGTASAVQVRVNWNEDGTVQSLVGSGEGGTIEPVSDGLYRFYKNVQGSDTGGNAAYYIWPASFVGDGSTTGTVIVGGLQVEEGTLPTAFQKTGATLYDVTEAGVPSLNYLDFDGNDYLVSMSIDLTRVRQATMFAGVLKNYDGPANNYIMFHGPSSAEVGYMALVGKRQFLASIGTSLYAAETRGSLSASTAGFSETNNQHLNAPHTAVITATFASSDQPRSTNLRVNQQNASTTTYIAGETALLNAPLYIGRATNDTGYFRGRLYSLGILGGEVPNVEITEKLEAFVAAKTGVAL